MDSLRPRNRDYVLHRHELEISQPGAADLQAQIRLWQDRLEWGVTGVDRSMEEFCGDEAVLVVPDGSVGHLVGLLADEESILGHEVLADLANGNGDGGFGVIKPKPVTCGVKSLPISVARDFAAERGLVFATPGETATFAVVCGWPKGSSGLATIGPDERVLAVRTLGGRLWYDRSMSDTDPIGEMAVLLKDSDSIVVRGSHGNY